MLHLAVGGAALAQDARARVHEHAVCDQAVVGLACDAQHMRTSPPASCCRNLSQSGCSVSPQAAGIMRAQQQPLRCCGVCSHAGTFQHDGVHLGMSRGVGEDVAADDVAGAVTADLRTESNSWWHEHQPVRLVRIFCMDASSAGCLIYGVSRRRVTWMPTPAQDSSVCSRHSQMVITRTRAIRTVCSPRRAACTVVQLSERLLT